jgi:hypothetical protein|tara:strand:+ start:60 stop:230 length:171 start_codon:yes stop_codon:yes gene_type:complete
LIIELLLPLSRYCKNFSPEIIFLAKMAMVSLPHAKRQNAAHTIITISKKALPLQNN